MINSVTVLGVLKANDENHEGVRFLEVERDYKDSYGNFQKDMLPLMYWTRDEKNVLFSLNDETLIVARGRIETFEDIIIIVVESLNLLSSKKNKVESL